MNGAEITVEAAFIAKTTDVEVEVAFTFDTSEVTEETELIVFENLYQDDVELGVHADIEDMEQTVSICHTITIEEDSPKGSAISDTGVNFVPKIMAFCFGNHCDDCLQTQKK